MLQKGDAIWNKFKRMQKQGLVQGIISIAHSIIIQQSWIGLIL